MLDPFWIIAYDPKWIIEKVEKMADVFTSSARSQAFSRSIGVALLAAPTPESSWAAMKLHSYASGKRSAGKWSRRISLAISSFSSGW